MKNRVIINADDFGWDKAATEGILQLAEYERITSTTIMANLVSVEELHRLRSYKKISTGIHINLISGKPLSNPSRVFSLIDPVTGNFYPAQKLWSRYLLGQVSKHHIQTEIKAQLDFLLEHGFFISHADSHQHLHIYPFIGKHIVNTLRSYNIRRIRDCNIPEAGDSRRFLIKIFNTTSRWFHNRHVYTNHLLSTFSYYKQVDMPTFKEKALPVILKGEITEWMVHPALSDRNDSYLHRRSEYDFLMSNEWEVLLKKNKVKKIGWREV